MAMRSGNGRRVADSVAASSRQNDADPIPHVVTAKVTSAGTAGIQVCHLAPGAPGPAVFGPGAVAPALTTGSLTRRADPVNRISSGRSIKEAHPRGEFPANIALGTRRDHRVCPPCRPPLWSAGAVIPVFQY